MLKTGKTRVYCNVKRLNSELNQCKYTHACFKWKQSESLVRRIRRLLDPPLFIFFYLNERKRWETQVPIETGIVLKSASLKTVLSLSLSTYSGLPKPFIYNTFSQSLKFLFLSLSLSGRNTTQEALFLSLTHSFSLSLSLCIYTSTNKHIYKLVL